MTKFHGEPNGEASGAYPDGEAWSVSFDKDGNLDATDEFIAAALMVATEHPDSPVKVVKGGKG